MTCPLFVELCAGTAALSLCLHNPWARPPVSRMGAKTGYADAILRVLGLRPGQGSADRTRYLWCEPDKGVRLLLEAYRARKGQSVVRKWTRGKWRGFWFVKCGRSAVFLKAGKTVSPLQPPWAAKSDLKMGG